MLYCFIGILIGGALVAAALVALQYVVVKNVRLALGYRFDKFVFFTDKFPAGDFEQGRVVRRCLYPAKASIRFFDRDYNEVTEAKKPGRYGAVVRMKLPWGIEMHRYLTLYRTPERVFWSNGPMEVDAKLPANTGIDPAVLPKQIWQTGEVIKLGFVGDGEATPFHSILLAGLHETSPNDPPAVERENVIARDTFWWYGLRKKLGLVQTYPHLTDFPEGYDSDPAKKWPLIIFLHGGNQNGNNLDIVRICGLAGAIHGNYVRPAAVVVSPQAPWYEDWNMPVLAALVEEACAKYRVDPDQVYMTGMSSGGVATWSFAMNYPNRLAAIFPVAGDGDLQDAARLKNLPSWAFTGLKDEVIPAVNVIALVKAIREAGGNPHITIYPDKGHNAEHISYTNQDLYTWLFAQRRGQPEVITPGLPEA